MFRDVTFRNGPQNQRVGPDVGSVRLLPLPADRYHSRVTGQFNERQRINVLQAAGDRRHITGRVEKFHIPEHLDVVQPPVVNESVRPCFLILRKDVHLSEESELLKIPLIQPGLRRQHVVVLPRIGSGPESSGVRAGVVVQVVSLHEYGVSVHVDVVREAESLEFGIIMAVVALDDLTVFVTQCSAVPEHCHTVLGVIVQVFGTQGVAIFVTELHQRSPELGEALVDQVNKAFTAEHRVVLDNPDIAEGVDHVPVDVPQGRVADQKGGIMLEPGMAQSLPVVLAIFLDLLKLITTEQTDETVPLLIFLGRETERNQQKQE